MKRLVALLVLFTFLRICLFGQETVDTSVIRRITTEALHHSKVMDNAFYLSDVFGPRLTGSPGFAAAAEWAEKRLKEYGLVNIQREPFPWGRGWSAEGFRAELTAPQYAPLIGYPLPWSTSTKGLVKGEPVLAPFPQYSNWSEESFQEYFATYKGKLKGKIILLESPRHSKLEHRHPTKRYTDEELEALSKQWIHDDPASGNKQDAKKPFEYFADLLIRFYNAEGAALLVFLEWGNGGGVMQLSHAFGANWLHFPKYELPPPMIGLCFEHYNRIARLLNHRIPVQLGIEVKTRIEPTAATFNLTAEITGTDKADEIVMIGGHLDSWTAGTGATDNAAGVSVMMEAVRILKTLDLKPRRTIRIALWGGHEGEGTGARTYVNNHFGNRKKPKPEYNKISAYFNLDNGTGRIRGIYANENEQIVHVFKKWFEPFASLGASVVSINKMTGTDHVRFEEAGIPGFQFIQDPIEYNELTHHTNMDLYDHLKEADLKQASAIIASFAYLAATREELLPRKPVK